MKQYLFSAFFVALLFFSASIQVQACDFDVSVSANNIVDNGDGTFSIDVLMCVGTQGSENGPLIYLSDGINIISTSANELINPYNGNTAIADVSGGQVNYSFTGNPGEFWVVDNDEFGPCFNFTLTVDGDPAAATISFENINDNCLNDISGGVWSTDISSGGACVADASVIAPATFSGNTNGGGNDCDFRPSDDQIIEVEIVCPGVYTFSTCDAALWDTYMFLSLDCCGGEILENDDWCGAQSEITTYLPAGTYYITLEGFDVNDDGAFELEVIEGEPLYKPETGPDQNICETTTTITANDPIFGGGIWTVITGNSTVLDPTNPTTDVIDLSNGVNQFIWTIGEGDCTIDSDTLTVIAAGNLTINCPADITVDNDPDECTAVVNYTAPTGSSECSTVTITQISGLGSGSAFPVGTTEELYLIEDTLGNIDSCAVLITVVDVEDPAIDCIADFSVNNDPGECSAVVTFQEPTGTDNCPGVTTTLISGLPSGSTFPVGSTNNIYETEDASGNTNICTIEITVEDVEDPVFDTCPDDIVVEIDPGDCNFVVDYPVPAASDNCPGPVTVVQTAGLAPNSIFPAGETTITYEATDANGNTAICTFTVTVTEPVLPEITCPSDITVDTDPDECGAVVNYVPPMGTDNCPGAATELISGLAPGSTFPVGTTTVVYQVTDASGNTAECAFDVTVEDNEDPEIICPSDINVNNEEGLCGATVDFTAPTGSDNCPDFTVSLVTDLGPGDFFPVGTNVVSYIIEDASGNVASCSFNVVVTDVEDPEPNCSDISVDNDPGACSAIVDYEIPTATDNCNGTITGALVSGQGPGATFEVGVVYEEIYSFTDDEGNEVICTFNVTVNDTELPELECPEDEVIILDPGECTANIHYEFPEGTDNCPGVNTTYVSGPLPASTVPAGEHTIVFEAEDASGNTTTCSFTITVVETIDPTISCPEDIIAYSDPGICGTQVNYIPPVGEDNCPGEITEQTAGIGPGSVFPVGETTEEYTVTDLSGNTATCSFTVTVLDTIAPVIDCPADIEVDANTGECTAIVNYPAPTATDNCDDDVTVELIEGPASGSEFTVGTTTIIYEATDESGNVTTCSFNITVNGESDPTITCPDDIIVSSAADSCGAFVDYPMPVAEDACGGDVSLTMDAGLESGSFFPIGTTTVVYTATNTLGNSASCSFDIIVADETAPVITCPEDIEIVATPEECEFVVDFDPATATDNCNLISVEQTEGDPSGSTFETGVHVITYEATDEAGNTSTCSFTITIVDEVDPTISDCPEDITVDNTPGECGAIVEYAAPVGDDNCDFTLSLTEGLDSGSQFPVGTTTVTWTVTDNSGNTASCSFDVTVNDVEDPTVICPEDIETCDPIVNWEVDANDNCTITDITVTEGIESGGEFPVGTTTVTVVVSDAAGNTATCSFNVTVAENPDQANAGPDQILCGTDETELEANNPENGVGFWEIVSGEADITGANDPNTTVTNIQPDSLVLSWTVTGNDICPSTTDFMTIIVEPEGFVDAGNDVTINGGESTDLIATASPDGGTYEWQPTNGLSCTNCPNPTASPTTTTTYTVAYTSENGCRYEDQVTVTVFNDIPNGFTPDGDGTNDVWNIPGVTENTEVMIFNRWGNKIYESVGYNEPWDGTYNNKPLPMGSFYYVIDYRDGSEPINGTITLIR